MILKVCTPHLFYGGTEPNLFDTTDPIVLGDKSSERSSVDSIDVNSTILGNDAVRKKRTLSDDSSQRKRNCQHNGGLNLTARKGPVGNCQDSLFQNTPTLLAITFTQGALNAHNS